MQTGYAVAATAALPLLQSELSPMALQQQLLDAFAAVRVGVRVCVCVCVCVACASHAHNGQAVAQTVGRRL